MLLLSTDLSQNVASTRLETIPLPAAPLVNQEAFTIFQNFQYLAHGKNVDLSGLAADSEFGSPPYSLTVQYLPTNADFFDFVGKMTKSNARSSSPRIKQELANSEENVVANYMDRNFHYWAFNRVDVTEKVKTFPPLSYEFTSPFAYYPLRDSSFGNLGTTQVDIVLISNHTLRIAGSYAQAKVSEFSLSIDELESVWPAQWREFFKDKDGKQPDNLVAQHIQITGQLSELLEDVQENAD